MARHIIISIITGAWGNLKLSIEDDGIGMRSALDSGTGDHQYGLIGMQERATMIGARLEISSSPAGGTCVEVEICP
jgi:signal transduction histidine kinase